MVVKTFTAAALFAVSYAMAGPIWKEVHAKRSSDSDFGDFGFGNLGDFGNFGSSSFGKGSHVSFNGWGGFHSLDHFDDFYGSENFCGLETSSVTVVKQQQELVCHSVDVTIIQQQLAVIREYVKKIITTQICEVETQTIVFSQFQSGLYGFGEDIRHHSSRQLGFDSSIANHITNIHDESGELTCTDLGFNGQEVGNSMLYPSGYNWVEETSPSSVDSAYEACQSAASYSGEPDALPPSSDCTSDCEAAPPSDCTSDCDVSSPPSDCTSNCDASPPESDCESDCPSTTADSPILPPPPAASNATATDVSASPPAASDSSSAAPDPTSD